MPFVEVLVRKTVSMSSAATDRDASFAANCRSGRSPPPQKKNKCTQPPWLGTWLIVVDRLLLLRRSVMLNYVRFGCRQPASHSQSALRQVGRVHVVVFIAARSLGPSLFIVAVSRKRVAGRPDPMSCRWCLLPPGRRELRLLRPPGVSRVACLWAGTRGRWLFTHRFAVIIADGRSKRNGVSSPPWPKPEALVASSFARSSSFRSTYRAIFASRPSPARWTRARARLRLRPEQLHDPPPASVNLPAVPPGRIGDASPCGRRCTCAQPRRSSLGRGCASWEVPPAE